MNVIINGTTQQLSTPSLSAIVSSYCKNPKHVITELNGSIIPADHRQQINLKEGDTLEIVTFVGGG